MTPGRLRLDIDTTRDRLLALGCSYAAEHLDHLLTEAVGEAMAPHAFLDRLLANDKRGYQGQQTGEKIDLSQWHDNVDKPVDENRDFGVHGVFDDQSRTSSFALWATMHKPLVAGVLGAGLSLAAAGFLRRRPYL